MASKKDNTILWIIGIILALLILNYYQKSQDEGIGLKVHYYQNGIEVFPNTGLFSTVTPPGGTFDAIRLDITGKNTGGSDLTNMQIVNATPLAFKNALPTTTQTLTVGQTKTLWTSSVMTTSQFETMAQPVRFWVNISGKDVYTGKTIYNSGYVGLFISAFYPQQTSVFYVVEDTYTREKSPTTNYGTSTTLNICPHCGTISGTSETYLKFNVTNISSPNIQINSITLYIYGSGTGTEVMNTFSIKNISNEWHESTLIYNTGIDGNTLFEGGTRWYPAGWYSYNLPNIINNGFINLRLDNQKFGSDCDVCGTVRSKEYTGSYASYLLVNYEQKIINYTG